MHQPSQSGYEQVAPPIGAVTTVDGLDCGEGVAMLEVGDRSPAVVATSYDGQIFNLDAPGKRTVLWFSPKGGFVDELSDRLVPAWSP